MLGYVLALLLAAAAARELDPAACAQRFDVQRDKIIRTEESREMGARYLSELDVGARHECRRLCCETDACDVFVYEEKSPGSCYLFNCGPPEDFRCKFTAHSNFSSGVLALSRRLAELQDQERLANTAPPPPPPPLPRTTPSARSSTTVAPTPAAAPPAPAHTTPRPSGRCSRYQWECHSGGECIAVYNACDGVPQCADGSDEAPELGCPATPLAPARAPPPPNPLPQLPVFPAPMYEGGGGGGGGGARWPHRLLQAQPQQPRESPEAEAAGPHIFAHAGGLLQQPAAAFEPPAPPPWPRRPYAPHPGVESGWGGWGRGGPDWDARRVWAQPVPPDPIITQPELAAYGAGGGGGGGGGEKQLPELALLYGEGAGGAGGAAGGGALRDAPKKGPRPAPPSPPPPPPPPPSRPDPQDNTTKKKAAAVQSEASVTTVAPPRGAESGAHAHEHAASAPHAQRDERDGLSERPPAAVLLLVLGLAMTGALGAALALRARGGRRRARGRALAHDADYLVNGMYL